MSSLREQSREDTHFRVLRLLEVRPHMSQRELARAVGISAGSAHYVVNALIDKGFVKIGNFSAAQNKRSYVYVLTPKGLAQKAAITKRFLARKIKEYEALRTEIEELEAEVKDK